MARPQAFERELRVATAGIEPEAISKLLAQTARNALAEVQANGQAPRHYERVVNGRRGAAEESVIPPGPIVYEFSWLPEIAEFALNFARERSPVLSGRYKRSWFAMVNGTVVADLDAMPPEAELIITNDQPYSRKIDVGAMKMRVPPGIAEDTRQAVMRRFGNIVQAERQFINLAGGYVLREGRGAGTEVSYPAVVIRQRF